MIQQILAFFVITLLILGCGMKADDIDLRQANLVSSDSKASSGSNSSDAEKSKNSNSTGSNNSSGNTSEKDANIDDSKNPSPPTKITSVALGLASMKGRSVTGRAYQEIQYEAFIPASTQSNLEEAVRESIPRYIQRKKNYQVKHWYKRDSGVCKYHVQIENDSGRIYGAKDRSCLEQNAFGFQKCENMQSDFLGLKNIESFKSAWGVRVTCRGKIKAGDQGQYAESVGQNFKSIREIWFHPDSNHYLGKVQEVRLALVESSSRGTIDEQISTEKNSKVHLFEYRNREPSSPADKDLVPPVVAASYRLTGAVKAPGVYTNQAVCKPSIFDSNQLGSIAIGRLSIGENIRSNAPGIHVMQGIWAPNFEPGPYLGFGGAFIHGLFNNFSGRNRNFFQTGTFSISITPNGPYLKIKVTRSNAVTLLIDSVSNAGQRYAYIDQISEINCIQSLSSEETNNVGGMMIDEF